MQAGELADEYEQARRPDMETSANSAPKPTRVGPRECQYCGKSGHGHAEEDCYKRKREESQRSRGTQCKKQGHMSRECPERSMVCK